MFYCLFHCVSFIHNLYVDTIVCKTKSLLYKNWITVARVTVNPLSGKA